MAQSFAVRGAAAIVLGLLAVSALGARPSSVYDILFSFPRFYGFLESYKWANPGLNIDPHNRTALEELADKLNIILVEPYSPQPHNNSWPACAEVAPRPPGSRLPHVSQQDLEAGAKDLVQPEFAHPYGIISGEPAPPGRYTYTTSLRVPPGGEHFCGGTLIRDSWVLTAAHCFYDEGTGRIAEEIFHPDVAVGRYDRSADGNGSLVLKSVQTIIHPGFTFGTNFTNDAALLQLERAVPFPAVKLNDGQQVAQDAGLAFTILGWGLVTRELSQVLRQGTVPLVPRAECEQVQAFHSVGAPITDTMLCAGQVQPKKENQVWPAIPPVDACQGDSGGPMLQPGSSPADDMQFGIISFGVGCGKPGVPGVYTDIQAVLPFIQSTIASEGNAGRASPADNQGNLGGPGPQQGVAVRSAGPGTG